MLWPVANGDAIGVERDAMRDRKPPAAVLDREGAYPTGFAATTLLGTLWLTGANDPEALALGLECARLSRDISIRQFIGAACLCGIGDTVSLLMADQAFPSGAFSGFAKIGVLLGSILAALLGAAVIVQAAHTGPVVWQRGPTSPRHQ